jgi:hypothetical protein
MEGFESVATADLVPGDVVRVAYGFGFGAPERIVLRVTDSGWVNRHDEPILRVDYADMLAPFGTANTSAASSVWDVKLPRPSRRHPARGSVQIGRLGV